MPAPPLDLACRIEVAARERTRASDGVARALVRRRLRLEQPEHPLGAVGGPGRHGPALGLAQSLW